MRQMFVLLGLVAAVMAFVLLGRGTVSAPASEAEDLEATRTLNIMLYPYIPDANNDNFASYIQRVEREFEAQYPEIDLILEMDVADNTYSLSTLESLFVADGPDAIELDLMMLGYVVEQGWAAPIGAYDTSQLLELPIQAATINETLYAMPSRICSLYLFGYDQTLVTSSNTAQLVEAIATLNPDGSRRGLLGEFYGETSLPTYYTSFYGGVYGNASLADAFQNPTDPAVINPMADLFGDCTFEGENWCLGDHYKSEAGAPQDFAEGDAVAYIGFSESLNYMLTTNPAQAYVEPAPFGDAIDPIFYTDAFTINAAACTGQCAEDAKAFAQYYASVPTQLWTNLAEDAVDSPPRYLLSANADFYQQPQVTGDPYYPALSAAIDNGFPFPSQGFPAARDSMFPEICNALDEILPDNPCLMPSAYAEP
jgi:thiamine pyridinylase